MLGGGVNVAGGDPQPHTSLDRSAALAGAWAGGGLIGGPPSRPLGLRHVCRAALTRPRLSPASGSVPVTAVGGVTPMGAVSDPGVDGGSGEIGDGVVSAGGTGLIAGTA